MRRFQSTYVTGNGDAVDGRTRVVALIYVGEHTGSSVAPLVQLHDGTSGGGVLLYANNNPNSYDTSVYGGGTNTLDLPSEGVLFPDGVYATLDANIVGACIVFEGGKAA